MFGVQGEDESHAAIVSSLDPRFPIVRFNDGAAAQAQSLGRMEGIEYFVQMDFGNADMVSRTSARTSSVSLGSDCYAELPCFR